MKGKTLILGASEKSERYSYKAAEKLLANDYPIYMIGSRQGEIFDHPIKTDLVAYEDVDTVTMYLSAKNQLSYIDYIISLKPRRVIFNPGTENPDFAEKLKANGIETEIACTLVLLATGAY